MKEAYDQGDENQFIMLLTFDDFQKSTNLHIYTKYLIKIFNDIQSTTNLDEIRILTSLIDYEYLQKVTELIFDTPANVLDFYIRCSIVLELWKLYEKVESEMYVNECVSKVVESMPMAATHAILKANFLAETKPQIELMAENIRSAFNNSIKRLDWIDSGTKQSILDKSNAMTIFVGPPEWAFEADKLDEFYAELTFEETSHVENIINFRLWEKSIRLKRSHLDWHINPTDVNAYYILQYNAICLYLSAINFRYRKINAISILINRSTVWCATISLLRPWD